MRRALFIALLVFLAAAGPGCGNNATAVLVDLSNIPTGTVGLRVQASLDGTQFMPIDDLQVANQVATQIGFYLPDGTQGTLTLRIDAIDAAPCVLDTRSGSTQIPGPGLWEFSIAFGKTGIRMCPFVVSLIGAGTGTVTSAVLDQTGNITKTLTCSSGMSPCTNFLPDGTLLQITAQPTATAYFGGFGGPCLDPSTCALTTSGADTVTARFHPRLCSTGGFCWEHPLPQGNPIFGLWASGRGNEVWAAGGGGTILRYDGVSWTASASGVTQDLQAVWGAGPRNIWAVGAPSATGTTGPILNYNGSAWFAQTVPSAAKTRTLWAVWASSAMDAWAAGDAGTLLHWNGSSWSPVPSGVGTTLYGLWGSAPTDVWAVGDLGTILHFTGGGWTTMQKMGSKLHGVWGSDPGTIWAVGDNGTILYYNGASWTAQPSGTTAALSDVWASGPSDAYAVGSGVALHYNGAAWTQLPSPPGNLWAASGTGPAAALFAGDAGFIAQSDGVVLTSQTIGNGESLRAVWASGPTDVWAVGDAAAILHGDGQNWTVDTSGAGIVANDLYAVWGSGPTDVWAVGKAGTIAHTDGSSGWGLALTPASTPDLQSVWGSGPMDVWAVGKNGAILHFPDGTGKWAKVSSGTTNTLYGVWAAGPADAWIAGDKGLILHWDGTSWTTSTSGTTATLYGVWGSGSGTSEDVWVVGNGVALRNLHGGGWRTGLSTMTAILRTTIAGTGPNDVWFGGAAGQIEHFDGTALTVVPSGTSIMRTGLWAVVQNPGEVYSVGPQGGILHRKP